MHLHMWFHDQKNMTLASDTLIMICIWYCYLTYYFVIVFWLLNENEIYSVYFKLIRLHLSTKKSWKKDFLI